MIKTWFNTNYFVWLNRLFGTTQPCLEIGWDEVVRIEALGHDAIGPFEICVTFTHSDGSEATIYVHTKGYEKIVTSLHRRFRTISPKWYEEMMSHPDWHVERLLYSRDAD
jgi:hypothetical protein